MSSLEQFDQDVAQTRDWFASPRFDGITRLYSPRQVAEQRGTIRPDYAVARAAAEDFYGRLRELFDQRESITTFGPYSPGQAVAMKRAGIAAIYLGGWATSAKGSYSEDPGDVQPCYGVESSGTVTFTMTANKQVDWMIVGV